MSQARDIITGDTSHMLVNLTRNGAPFVVNAGSTVTAGLVTLEGVLYAGPWSVTDAVSGSDWDNGIIVVVPDGAETELLAPNNYLELEIQVMDVTETSTWRIPNVRLVKGGLP